MRTRTLLTLSIALVLVLGAVVISQAAPAGDPPNKATVTPTPTPKPADPNVYFVSTWTEEFGGRNEVVAISFNDGNGTYESKMVVANVVEPVVYWYDPETLVLIGRSVAEKDQYLVLAVLDQKTYGVIRGPFQISGYVEDENPTVAHVQNVVKNWDGSTQTVTNTVVYWSSHTDGKLGLYWRAIPDPSMPEMWVTLKDHAVMYTRDPGLYDPAIYDNGKVIGIGMKGVDRGVVCNGVVVSGTLHAAGGVAVTSDGSMAVFGMARSTSLKYPDRVDMVDITVSHNGGEAEVLIKAEVGHYLVQPRFVDMNTLVYMDWKAGSEKADIIRYDVTTGKSKTLFTVSVEYDREGNPNPTGGQLDVLAPASS